MLSAKRLGKAGLMTTGGFFLGVRALGWIIFVRLGLWLVPYRWLHAWAGRASDAARGHTAARDEVLEIVRAVRSKSRFVPGATCLTQALVAQAMLGWSGQSSELRIGVAKSEAGTLIAHAWLEIGDRVVIGKIDDLGRYAVLEK